MKQGKKLTRRVIRKVIAHLKTRGHQIHKNKIPKEILSKILNEPNATVNYLVHKYYDLYIFKGELPLEIVQDQSKFYKTRAWKDLREMVFSIFGRKCLCCGSKKDLHIDHVKPRSRYPELAMKIKNLQPLCKECNCLKGTQIIDYRDESLHKSRKQSLENRRGTIDELKTSKTP